MFAVLRIEMRKSFNVALMVKFAIESVLNPFEVFVQSNISLKFLSVNFQTQVL